MKVLIFGGTTEGRTLSTALSKAGIDITLSVATEFGRSLAAPIPAASDGITVLANRAGKEDMINLMRRIKNEIDPNGIMNPYKVLPPPAKVSNY